MRADGVGDARLPRDWIFSTAPNGGVELRRAWFAGRAYSGHRHDTYAIGVTETGIQTFDYRGATRTSAPGQVVVLHPDEPHDGRAGSAAGFGYRIAYVAPSLVADAAHALCGTAVPLPFVGAVVSSNALLAEALAGVRREIRVGKPVAEIALDAGFADQSHMTRMFRAAYGLSPAHYRAVSRE